jgi:hypothetical protein
VARLKDVPFPFCTLRPSVEAVNRPQAKLLQRLCSRSQKELVTAKVAKKSRKGAKTIFSGRHLSWRGQVFAQRAVVTVRL